MPSDSSVWFITGCSSGFGREIARQVLERGNRAVITARDPASLDELVQQHPGRALALRLDVTRPDEILAAVNATLGRFGQIDVLVNNAGYGFLASFEAAEEVAYRQLFETNLFGAIAMTRAVLPGMRERRKGHIINMSSIVGFAGVESAAYYAASKFGLEGLSEALAEELRPLGIAVTIVEPSGFRTSFAGRSMRTGQDSIPEYADTVGARIARLKEYDGRQAGDPKRAAAAIIDIGLSASAPMRLLLGADAFRIATGKLARLSEEFAAWEGVTRSADFDD